MSSLVYCCEEQKEEGRKKVRDMNKNIHSALNYSLCSGALNSLKITVIVSSFQSPVLGWDCEVANKKVRLNKSRQSLIFTLLHWRWLILIYRPTCTENKNRCLPLPNIPHSFNWLYFCIYNSTIRIACITHCYTQIHSLTCSGWCACDQHQQ